MNSSSNKSFKEIQIPIASRWIVPEEKLKSALETMPWRYTTHLIENVPYGIDYCLCIGQDDESRSNDVEVSLEIVSNERIEADFSFSIESANCIRNKKFTYDKENNICSEVICTLEEALDPANNFIVDGQFIIKAQGIFIIRKPHPIKAPNARTCRMAERLWKRNDKDITIVAGGKEVKAHKMVLVAQSPVFDAMFESNMRESIDNKVYITDFDAEVVQAAVEFCYDRGLSSTITVANACSLLYFADKYDMEDLKVELEEYFDKEITASTVCQIANGSLIGSFRKLQKKCLEFLVQSVKESAPVCDFDLLDNDLCKKVLKEAFYFTSTECCPYY